MKMASSSSESRLIIFRALKKPACTPAAPVRPRSSSTVSSTSTGPWATLLSSARASPMATPMPLSAPRVVPSAVTQSPSTFSLMGILLEVVLGGRVLLADHVHVALDQHRRGLLQPLGGRDGDQQVAHLVLAARPGRARRPRP